MKKIIYLGLLVFTTKSFGNIHKSHFLFSEGSKNCQGTWVSKNGHLLTSLDCLSSCLVQNKVAIQLSNQKLIVKVRTPEQISCPIMSESFRVVALGAGFEIYNSEELKKVDHVTYHRLIKKPQFQGDGNYALLQHSNSNQTCLPLNPKKIPKGEALFALKGGFTDLNISEHNISNVTQVPVIEKSLGEILGTVFPWNLVPKYPYGYLTRKSILIQNQNRVYGAPIVVESLMLEGIMTPIRGTNLGRVLKMESIYLDLEKILGVPQVNHIFDCNRTEAIE